MNDNTLAAQHQARAQAILDQMTLDEKLAQIVGFWDKGDGEAVAPLREFQEATTFTGATRHGLGHITRAYGTRPVDPIERAAWLWNEQRRIIKETRLGIPMLVHEECLTGLSAWKAATFPTPLSWGASFNPELVEKWAPSLASQCAHWAFTKASHLCSMSSGTHAGVGSKSAFLRTLTQSV